MTSARLVGVADDVAILELDDGPRVLEELVRKGRYAARNQDWKTTVTYTYTQTHM